MLINILSLKNDFSYGEDELMNAQTLPKAKMPNSEGFIWAYSPSE